jgi:hypothetical protein
MTSTPPSRPPAERTLLATTDAGLWAEEFVRIFNGATIGSPQENHSSGHTYVDEGTMLAWFANAIETGRNFGRKETCSHSKAGYGAMACPDCGVLMEDLDVEELDEIVMTPFDQDDDDDEVEPTLEEKFKEGFDEGR